MDARLTHTAYAQRAAAAHTVARSAGAEKHGFYGKERGQRG